MVGLTTPPVRFRGVYVSQIALHQPSTHAESWAPGPTLSLEKGHWEMGALPPDNKGKRWREGFEPVINFKEGGSWVVFRATGRDAYHKPAQQSPWGLYLSPNGRNLSFFFPTGDGRSFKQISLPASPQRFLALLEKATIRSNQTQDEEAKVGVIALAQRLLAGAGHFFDAPGIRRMMRHGMIREMTAKPPKALLREAKALFKRSLNDVAKDKISNGPHAGVQWPQVAGRQGYFYHCPIAWL